MAVLSNTGIRAGASAGGGGGYQIEKSLRFNEPDDAKLSRTFTSAGDQKKFTLSFWFKNCDAGATNSKMLFCLDNGGSSQLELYAGNLYTTFYSPDGTTWAVIMNTSTTHKFRDPSAWYHIVLSVDTTAGTTNADRQKIYINGEQLDLTFTTYWGGLMTGDVKGWNTAAEHFIGMRGASYGGNWLAAEYYFIDGQGLDASSFGETDSTTGQWVAKEYTGTYGPLFDQSQTWSTAGTYSGAAWSSSYVWSQAFHGGDLYSGASVFAENNGTYKYTFAGSGLTVNSSVSVYYWKNGGTIKVNEGESDEQTLSASTATYESTTYTAAQIPVLKNIEIATSSSTGPYLTGIKVDGKLLVDNGLTLDNNGFYLNFNGTDLGEDSSGNDNDWTATNLTASQLTTVSAATGGLPIYNTSGDQGGTKVSGYRTDSSAGTTDGTGLVFAMPGDVLTDEHDEINTGSSANTMSGLATAPTASTAKSKYYGTSLKFTGNGGINSGSIGDLAFGTGDYTIECWFYDDSSYGYLWDLRTSSATAGTYIYWSSLTQLDSLAVVAGGITSGEWHHVAMVRSSGTVKIYIDGVEKDSASETTDYSSATSGVTLGSRYTSGSYYTGYIQDFRVYKGVAKYSSDFSVAKKESTDVDVSTDSPTTFDDGGNGTGNYCTLNPLHHLATATLTQGNLKTTSSNPAFSTFLLTSGKWYCEHTVAATGYNLCFSQVDHASGDTPSSTGSKSIGYYSNGTFYWGAGSAALGASYAIGDVLAAAIDMDSSTIKVYKNNSLQTTIDFSTGTYHRFTEGMYVSQFNGTGWWNFGARAFAYTPPSGYKAINTYNLPDPVITDPSKYFDTKLYTGTGATHAITGLNFSPDLVWIKKYTSASHAVFDAVRGVQERLKTDSTAAEGTDATTLTAFGTEGFTLSTHDDINQNTDSYVSWNWDAGTANESVSAGDLNSTVYDQSQTWSDALACNVGFHASYPVTRGFDGIFQGDAGIASATDVSPTFTFTPPASITVTSLEFNVYGTVTLTLPDGSTQTIVGVGASNIDVAADIGSGFTFTGSNSITLSGAADYLYLERIKINGKELVDSGVTVAYPSIASTYRANPEAGFSIVSYTATGTVNQSIAHGLNTKPDFMIFKSRDSTANWNTWHKDYTTDQQKVLYLNLDSAGAAYSGGSSTWWYASPDSNVFWYGEYGSSINVASGDKMNAFIWSEVAGYSKFGSYVGTGLSDPAGTFVYCGFKPAWIMVKNTAATEEWWMWDSKRNGYNPTYQYLEANDTDAENSTTNDCAIDLVSNGFKIRMQYAPNNTNTYIFAAFAETPFKYANAR